MALRHASKLQVRYVAPADLTPYAKNARTHSPAQVAQIAASITEFGFTNPILTDGNGGVIAGHGRLLAAGLLGLAQVPVIDLLGLSDAKKRALVLADNRIAANAGWDEALLAAELGELSLAGLDLTTLGFDEAEIAKLLGTGGGQTDPDEVPAPPAIPVVALGELWSLGKHRLLIGDSTDPKAVARLLDGARPHLMVTDPPYGVEYDANWRNQRVRKDGSPIAGRAVGKVSNDDRSDWRDAFNLFPGDVAYAWSAGLRSKPAIEGLEGAGFLLRAQIIWAKTCFAIGRGDYHFQHEPCWYAVRKGKKGCWTGDRKQTTLWTISHIKSETGHSTQKPVECMRRPILNNSKRGDAVYDPFLGSGTTLIAAEMEGRRVLGLEIDPVYGQVIIERWEAFTGKMATREDGKTLKDLKAKPLSRRAARVKVPEKGK